MNTDLSRTEVYDYILPKELIAQNPVEPRDASRLLALDKSSGKTEEKIFRDVAEYLNEGDLLVMNDTRVLPARVSGFKKNGSRAGARVEIFFLNPRGASGAWEALVRPGRRLPPGTNVEIGEGVSVAVGARLEDGLRVVKFGFGVDAAEIIRKYGKTPLPPYITRSSAEPERYQTVYAKREKENSAAAPTAGLHFTRELLDKIKAKGVKTTFVTLRVGLGTFRPVKAENIKDHVMHKELCEVSPDASAEINAAKGRGGRVVAVGTTVVRTLEGFMKEFGEIKPGTLETSLFITPGYNFQAVDALITNFHLPKSTLLMLVCAFGGYGAVMSAYREAVEKRYRFFSFGDAMFIG